MSEITYKGLGFPVILKGVKTREFRGETLPDVNHRKLEDQVFRALMLTKAQLSGAHLAFIRGYMKQSQQDLATLLGLKSHGTVSGWEAKGSAATGMLAATEVVLRMLMADYIHEKTFAAKFKEYLGIRKKPEALKLKVA